MKYIPEEYSDIIKLGRWLNNGELTVEEYLAACNEYSKKLVNEQLKYPGLKNGLSG